MAVRKPRKVSDILKETKNYYYHRVLALNGGDRWLFPNAGNETAFFRDVQSLKIIENSLKETEL
jgi:hypothetical protein